MTRIFLFLFLKPFSKLPLTVLYLFSDFLFLLMKLGVSYRKQVVMENLRGSFPDKSEKELKRIALGFYRHFYDLIFETIRTTSMGKEEAMKRCRVTNPGLLEEYFKNGQSVVLISGHYNNWEFTAFVQPLFSGLHPLGIYAPLANRAVNDYIVKSRGKFGMELVPKKQSLNRMLESIEERPTSIFLLSDQCPRNPYRAYWTTFLNRETGYPYGAGIYSVRYNLPVVFARIEKVSRGFYEITNEVLEDSPSKTSPGEIIEKFSKKLEDQILHQPENWLWTHKRWKRQKPADYDKINKD